ncbi:MAG TPA: hypothetical protein VGN12_06600 [Pirellulales bacterium]|jgi:hypothetical protein
MAFSYDRGSNGGSGHQIKAGQAYYDLRMKDDGFTATLQKSGAQVKNFGVAVAGVGAKLTALGGILVGPMTAAAKVFKDLAIDTSAMAKKLDISVESMSALAYAAERAGTSVKALGTDQEAWQKFFSNNGGEKGIRALIERARELGVVLSGEDAKAAEEYRVAMVDLQASLRAITISIGGAVVPVLTAAAKKMQQVTQRVVEWSRQNTQLIAQAFQIAKQVAITGAVMTALGGAIATVGLAIGTAAAGFTVLIGAVAAILSPVGILVVGLAALGGYFLHASGVGSTVLAALGQAFQRLKSVATETFAGISDALSGGDIKLSAQILWATLKTEWLRGTAVLDDIWQQSQQGLVNAFASVAEKLSTVWQALHGVFAAIGDEIEAKMTAVAEVMKSAFEDASKVIGKALWNLFYVIGEINGRITRALGQLKSALQFFGILSDDRKNSRGGNVVGGYPGQEAFNRLGRGASWAGGKILSGIFRDQPYVAPPIPKRNYGPTRVTKIDGVPVDGSAPATPAAPPVNEAGAPPAGLELITKAQNAFRAALGALVAGVAGFEAKAPAAGRGAALAEAVAERNRLIAEAAAARQHPARNKLGDLQLPSFASAAGGSVSGTFSGIGVGRLGTGSAVDRIAKASERWVKIGDDQIRLLGEVRDQLRNVGGAKFGD